MALGVVIAVGGGGYAISKKYDIGMDDISATIAYLEANAFGASSVAILDSQTHELAPTPAPTPAASGPAAARAGGSCTARTTPPPLRRRAATTAPR